MLVVKQHDGSPEMKPGTYKKVRVAGKWSARFRCPKCEVIAGLHDHEIRQDGTVSPSVLCNGPCDFHDHLRLEGW